MQVEPERVCVCVCVCLCVCMCVCNITNNRLGHVETEPQHKVSSDRLVKLRIKPATPGLLGDRFSSSETHACFPLIEAILDSITWLAN